MQAHDNYIQDTKITCNTGHKTNTSNSGKMTE